MSKTTRRGKIPAELALEILDLIADRNLEPGTVIATEAELTAQFGVGRASVREAIRILEVQGIVSLKRGPGGGLVTERFGSADLARMAMLHFQVHRATYGALVEARLVLEPLLARLAAERSDPGPGPLSKINAEAAASDEAAMMTRFRDFHQAIEDMAGNMVLGLVSGSLRDVGREQAVAWDPLKEHVLSPEGRRRNQRQHEAIARAVERGDGRAAERLMRSHLKELLEATPAAKGVGPDLAIRWSPTRPPVA